MTEYSFIDAKNFDYCQTLAGDRLDYWVALHGNAKALRLFDKIDINTVYAACWSGSIECINIALGRIRCRAWIIRALLIFKQWHLFRYLDITQGGLSTVEKTIGEFDDGTIMDYLGNYCWTAEGLFAQAGRFGNCKLIRYLFQRLTYSHETILNALQKSINHGFPCAAIEFLENHSFRSGPWLCPDLFPVLLKAVGKGYMPIAQRLVEQYPELLEKYIPDPGSDLAKSFLDLGFRRFEPLVWDHHDLLWLALQRVDLDCMVLSVDLDQAVELGGRLTQRCFLVAIQTKREDVIDRLLDLGCPASDCLINDCLAFCPVPVLEKMIKHLHVHETCLQDYFESGASLQVLEWLLQKRFKAKTFDKIDVKHWSIPVLDLFVTTGQPANLDRVWIHAIIKQDADLLKWAVDHRVSRGHLLKHCCQCKPDFYNLLHTFDQCDNFQASSKNR